MSTHSCRGIVIHCMDFRFVKGLVAYLTRTGLLGNVDVVGWAGAGKPFLHALDAQFVLQQIELSSKLHQIKEVHVFQHIDCGAYGGSAKLGAREKEFSFQLQQLEEIAQRIQSRFPHLTVYGHIAEKQDSESVGDLGVIFHEKQVAHQAA